MSAAALGIHPLVDALAERIRGCWLDLPELAPLAVDPDLEAISGSLDGEDLFIRNELHSSRGLRKLHLETARLGAGLQILHCVFFPDPRYDLPVFGADIVAGRGVVSAAIVDLSPVTGSLPEAVVRRLEALPARRFSQERELPAWGTIFSPYVRFVRPADAAEEQVSNGLHAQLGCVGRRCTASSMSDTRATHALISFVVLSTLLQI
jgi:phycocyanobilin:ferredoxin oxidoreductase